MARETWPAMLMITSTPAPDPESSVDLDTVAHSWMRRQRPEPGDLTTNGAEDQTTIPRTI
jgi:hypothetical protein